LTAVSAPARLAARRMVSILRDGQDVGVETSEILKAQQVEDARFSRLSSSAFAKPCGRRLELSGWDVGNPDVRVKGLIARICNCSDQRHLPAQRRPLRPDRPHLTSYPQISQISQI
jgi:hypothetical protein